MNHCPSTWRCTQTSIATLIERPIPTRLFATRADFKPLSGSAYLFGQSVEERSHFSDTWRNSITGIDFVRIAEGKPGDLSIAADPGPADIPLRSERNVDAFIESFVGRPLYIDMTGLSHHVWASLLKSCLRIHGDVRFVYVEPIDYRFSEIPREGEIFDLSERIRGISPLPGFVRLRSVFDADHVFVPLLGFEGARLQFLLEQVEPPGDQICACIGVPGFRPEYPFYTYEGNRRPLISGGLWRSVRFAPANCPFEMFYLLKDISAEYAPKPLKIALIGTKPHALGAVLFACSLPDRTELIYDHPIRKAGRTEGENRVLVYHVSVFAQGWF